MGHTEGRMLFVGIDNGKNGGIAVINLNQEIVSLIPMPVYKGKRVEYDMAELSKFFDDVLDEENIFVVLEKAHVRPVSGKRACFDTGFGYGMMQAFLSSYNISYEIVDPKVWQKEILKGINTGDTKKDSIMFCKRKYPKQDFTATERSKKDHDGMTDALCMALYCYRINGGINK